MTRFIKSPSGWTFETAAGNTYEAHRLRTGGWVLARLTWYPVADGRYGSMTTHLDGEHGTRAEAVAFAETLDAAEAVR